MFATSFLLVSTNKEENKISGGVEREVVDASRKCNEPHLQAGSREREPHAETLGLLFFKNMYIFE